ncbi:LysR family transcriptional regulator [Vibrio sp. SCSIO 43135]|uniref:LysR family transcriptional regulator n=1 Tax=Vibrio sp. SCSIO 43135 TaxID=2819096 RepID=UPI00207507FC|nr:LysR family transcriptional regulator [Vibrio sp. SCSIO 43135]USD43388.1 LysR family transcriptional regulator [Vibrio sp. SCSIO 43135]
MDLNLLTTFLAVYKHRSITVASEELDLTQPAVSSAIKRLEAVVGKSLFVREGRGIAPTGAAVSLAHKVEDPINIINSVAESSEALNVYCTESMIPFLANVEGVNFIEAPLDEELLFDALIAQKVDLVIDVISNKRHSLVEEILFDDEAVCLTRKAHPRITDSLSYEQYFDESHIALKVRRSEMNTIDFLSDKPIQPRKISIETSSISSMLMLASTTDYIAASTRSLAELLAPKLNLTIHAIPLELRPIKFRMIYHRRYANDNQHMEVRDAIKSALPKAHT